MNEIIPDLKELELEKIRKEIHQNPQGYLITYYSLVLPAAVYSHFIRYEIERNKTIGNRRQ